eukprot:PhM_4_TR12810/c0_g1_i1/m.72750
MNLTVDIPVPSDDGASAVSSMNPRTPLTDSSMIFTSGFPQFSDYFELLYYACGPRAVGEDTYLEPAYALIEATQHYTALPFPAVASVMCTDDREHLQFCVLFPFNSTVLCYIVSVPRTTLTSLAIQCEVREQQFVDAITKCFYQATVAVKFHPERDAKMQLKLELPENAVNALNLNLKRITSLRIISQQIQLHFSFLSAIAHRQHSTKCYPPYTDQDTHAKALADVADELLTRTAARQRGSSNPTPGSAMSSGIFDRTPLHNNNHLLGDTIMVLSPNSNHMAMPNNSGRNSGSSSYNTFSQHLMSRSASKVLPAVGESPSHSKMPIRVRSQRKM